MNFIKKNLPLYILLVFLIVVNGFFLINHLGKSNHKRPKGKQENFIVRELKLNDVQKQKLEALDVAHHKRMREINEDEKELKDDLFNRISNEINNDAIIDSITTQIGDLAKEKELEIFQHFNAIQNMCDEKQKEKFKGLVRKALHRNGPGAPPHDKRREGNGPPPRH